MIVGERRDDDHVRSMRLQYPITLAMIGLSMLDVFVIVAQLKIRVGSRDPVLKAAIVVQAVTALEQFLRLILEERLDAEHGGLRAAAVVVKGISRAFEVSASRIEAFGHGFQSVAAIRRLADKYGPPALQACLKKMGGDLARLFDLRHCLVHALGVIRFDEGAHLRTVERFMQRHQTLSCFSCKGLALEDYPDQRRKVHGFCILLWYFLCNT